MNDCHIELKIGSTFNKIVRCLDENKDDVDLTGWQKSADVKVKSGRDILLSLNIDSLQEDEGILILSATAEQTNLLPANKHLECDIKLISPDGLTFYTETFLIRTSNHITD